MLGPEKRAALIERRPEQSIGARKIAELLIDTAKCLVELSLNRRLLIEISGFLNAAVHECDDAEAVRGTDFLVAALEKIQRELLDALRACSFRQRNVTRVLELQRIESDESDDCGERSSADNERTPVAPGELGDSVPGAVGAGFE